MKAVGSVWNKNAWHWEEKNCTKWGTQAIIELIEAIEYKVGAYNITITKGVKATGESNVNVRKQKLLYLYEFTIKGDWKATLIEKPTECVSGTFEVLERNQDDDDLHLTINVNDSKITPVFEKIAKELRKEMYSRILASFNKFMSLYQEFISRDMLKASQEQQQIETQKMEQANKSAPLCLPVKIETEAKGSDWNVNSYHWEEKPLFKWTTDRIKELFAALKFASTDFTILLKTVTPTGDANLNIRKGKKICTFDMKVDIEWATLHQKEAAESSGTICLSEIATDNDISKCKFVLNATVKGGDCPQVEVFIDTQMQPKLRELIVQLVAEMKDK